MSDERNDLTPARAIRAKCVACVDGSFSAVTKCTGYPDASNASGCDLWPWRAGKGAFDNSRGTARYTRTRAMRKECLRCLGTAPAVKTCPSEGCEIWPYRIGKGKCFDPLGEALTKRKSGQSAEQMQRVRSYQALGNSHQDGETGDNP